MAVRLRVDLVLFACELVLCLGNLEDEYRECVLNSFWSCEVMIPKY